MPSLQAHLILLPCVWTGEGQFGGNNEFFYRSQSILGDRSDKAQTNSVASPIAAGSACTSKILRLAVKPP